MTVELDADLSGRILKQVEFYFSDANLPRDKFLSAEVAKDADGWVDLATIASFSRMKALTEEVAVIEAALRDSKELLEVEAGKVRRRLPLRSGEGDDLMARTLYVKGFPRADNTVSLDMIEGALLKGGMAGIEAIRMRRFPKSKDFRGSAFVEFATAEQMEAALKCGCAFNGGPLAVESKQAYLLRKNNERTGKKEPAPAAIEFVPGCLLVVTDAAGMPAQHGEFKADFEAKTGVKPAFVDFRPDAAVMVRLKEAKAEECVAKVGCEKARLATDEEEKAYYDNLAAVLKEKASASKRRGPAHGHRSKRPRGD